MTNAQKALEELAERRQAERKMHTRAHGNRKPGWYPTDAGDRYWNGRSWESPAKDKNQLFIPAVITTVLFPIIAFLVWMVVFIVKRQYWDAFLIWLIGSVWSAVVISLAG